MRRSHQDRISGSGRDQFEAPKDEGAHENLAELDIGLHQRLQSMAVKLNHFAGLFHASARQRPPSREHVGLSGKFSRPMIGDRQFAVCGRLQNLNLSGNDHKKWNDYVSLTDEHFSALDLAVLSHGGDALDLRRRKLGEQLLATFR
jgi:hypothetical protein